MAGYDEGRYDCTVMGQGYGCAGKNQTQFFGIEVLPFKYYSGGGAVEVDAKFTRTVKLWMNSEDNVERSAARLKMLGWDGKFKDLEPGGDCDLTGMTVTLVNQRQESPDGKVWDGFDFPFDGPVETSIANDNSIAAKLDRMYKPNSKKKDNAATAETPDDSEVPF